MTETTRENAVESYRQFLASRAATHPHELRDAYTACPVHEPGLWGVPESPRDFLTVCIDIDADAEPAEWVLGPQWAETAPGLAAVVGVE